MPALEIEILRVAVIGGCQLLGPLLGRLGRPSEVNEPVGFVHDLTGHRDSAPVFVHPGDDEIRPAHLENSWDGWTDLYEGHTGV